MSVEGEPVFSIDFQETSMPTETTVAPPSPTTGEKSFFGHPRGLSTLFFTEMWERFSYYGMRALLILFMTAAVAEGGLGFDAATAGAVYGLYTAAVYLAALPGGWLADRLLGQRHSVFLGGVLIAAGHFTLALPWQPSFFAGLVLIVLGTGLLKPNISAIVGQLYSADDERRDAGFALFYMGINLGGFLAPLVCGYLGEQVSWHLGFGAAGVGMVLGLVQYVAGSGTLGGAGELATTPEAGFRRRVLAGLCAFGLVLLAIGGSLAAGWWRLDVIQLANGALLFMFASAVVFFVYTGVAGGLSGEGKRRLGAVAVLFLFSVVFWAGFEQGGSSFSLFARDHTDRTIGGWEFPASWFQFVNSAFVIALSAAFAALWLRLGRRQPSVPVKFALGLGLLGAGFAVLTWGARLAAGGEKVGLGWLVAVYFLHTCGELCLSPVGLSTTTRLAPKRLVGQMMGVWFLSIAIGNLLAGQVAGSIANLAMDEVFFQVFVVSVGAGLLMAILSRPVQWLMAGVR